MLESLEVDYIDESEVLTPADEANHIDKWPFRTSFVCGATNLGEVFIRAPWVRQTGPGVRVLAEGGAPGDPPGVDDGAGV